jgi:two-component system, LytTR family, response regulator
VTAFELMALDYLLKPFGRARFQAAVERARQALDPAERSPSLERARQALTASGPATRLFLRERGKIVPVAVAEIERAEAQDDYSLVFAAGRRHLVHVTLTDLERRLDPRRFLRVHRSHVVNVDHVVEWLRSDDGRLELHMRDGAHVLASRARSRDLRQLARYPQS